MDGAGPRRKAVPAACKFCSTVLSPQAPSFLVNKIGALVLGLIRDVMKWTDHLSLKRKSSSDSIEYLATIGTCKPEAGGSL